MSTPADIGQLADRVEFLERTLDRVLALCEEHSKAITRLYGGSGVPHDARAHKEIIRGSLLRIVEADE